MNHPGISRHVPADLGESDYLTVHPIGSPRSCAPLQFTSKPAGDVIDPSRTSTLGATFTVGTNMSYYRFTLPLPVGRRPAQEGTWHVILGVNEKIFERVVRELEQSPAAVKARLTNGVRYSLTAQTLSNLRLQADVSQTSLEPGATMTVRARLSEYGILVDHRATTTADLQRPDGTQAALAMPEAEPGVFETTTTAAAIAGIYRFRVISSGVTMRGLPFTREQQLSGAVVVGGNNPFPKSPPSTQGQDEALCRLLECLLGPNTLGRLLIEQKIDPSILQECVAAWCEARLRPPSAEELRQREGT